MKNPASPGDFGTNVTRGVVLSGMSETTKRALGADLIDLSVPWSRRIDPTHLIAAPVDQQALRASRLTTEGGAERETINSPPENIPACTGRKMTLRTVAFAAMNVVALLVLISSLGAILGLLTWVISITAGCLFAEFWIVRPRRARRTARDRTSVEEGA